MKSTSFCLYNMTAEKAVGFTRVFGEYATLPTLEDIIRVEHNQTWDEVSITMKSGISIICKTYLMHGIVYEVTDPMGGKCGFATYGEASDKLYEFALEAFKENYKKGLI